MTKDISIGGLSKATGVNIETIRYYERIGIIPAPPRTEGGHRVYDPGHQGRLNFVRQGRELGFTLDQIRTLLDLADGGSDTCAKVKSLTLDHLADVEQKIADLQDLRDVLSAHAAQCEGDLAPACPLIDTLYAA
ncbi:MAG: helix-turn-helix domain-containing protein [Alphaproteobacteria bacterium]